MRPEDDHQLTGVDNLRHGLVLVAFDIGHRRGDQEQTLVVPFQLRAPVSVDGVRDDELVDLQDFSQAGQRAFGGVVQPHPHEAMADLGRAQGRLQVGGIVPRSPGPQ